jgi:transcriptional regulatory protein RtcR
MRRMSTLAPGARIPTELVDEEIGRLRGIWGHDDTSSGRQLVSRVLGAEAADELDHFDAVQLEEVLRICQRSPSLAAAGRSLFAHARLRRKTVNDTDRLRKYRLKSELDWEGVAGL